LLILTRKLQLRKGSSQGRMRFTGPRILAYLLQMSSHGRTGLFRIVLLNRLQDALVVVLPAAGPTFDLKNPDALFPQQRHN
jgi:hypothetical protein